MFICVNHKKNSEIKSGVLKLHVTNTKKKYIKKRVKQSYKPNPLPFVFIFFKKKKEMIGKHDCKGYFCNENLCNYSS